MAIELQALVQIFDSDGNSILYKSERVTSLIVPEGTPLSDSFAVGKMKLRTIVSEAEADVVEQMDEAEKGMKD